MFVVIQPIAQRWFFVKTLRPLCHLCAPRRLPYCLGVRPYLYCCTPHQLAHVLFENCSSRSVVHELAVSARFHESGAGQFLQMVRDRSLPHRETTAQATTANFRLGCDVLEYLEPARIGQRFRDPLKLVDVHSSDSPDCTIDR